MVESPAGPVKPGDAYVQSFARGLAVLRSFGADAPSQTLSQAAERAGLTRAGARRILLTLQQLGYVESDGRQFRLTARVLELGYAYLSGLPLWQLAQPAMEALVREIQESCSAAVLDGDDIVYVLRVPAGKIMSINLGVGSRLPAWCTAMGRVLLAEEAPDALRARLQRLADAGRLTPLTPHTRAGVDALLAAIAEVRAQGHAVVSEELELGLVTVAVPIRDRNGRVVAAVNISGHTHRTRAEDIAQRLLPRLRATGEEIGRLLGG
jgi:IclR family pca regulon transcriptional regulator